MKRKSPRYSQKRSAVERTRHIRQSRPDSGVGLSHFQSSVHKNFNSLPPGSEAVPLPVSASSIPQRRPPHTSFSTKFTHELERTREPIHVNISGTLCAQRPRLDAPRGSGPICPSGGLSLPRRASPSRGEGLQGYLAHKKTPPP